MFESRINKIPPYEQWIQRQGFLNLISYLKGKEKSFITGRALLARLTRSDGQVKLMQDQKEYSKMLKDIGQCIDGIKKSDRHYFDEQYLLFLVDKDLLKGILNCIENCQNTLQEDKKLIEDLESISSQKNNALKKLDEAILESKKQEDLQKIKSLKLKESHEAIRRLKIPKVEVAPGAEEIATRGGALKLVGYLEGLLNTFGKARVKLNGLYSYDDVIISAHLGIEKLLDGDSSYFNNEKSGVQIDKKFIKDLFIDIEGYVKNGTNKARKKVLSEVLKKKNPVLKILTGKEKYDADVSIQEETRSEKEIKEQAKKAAAAIKRLKSKLLKEKVNIIPEPDELTTRGGALRLASCLEVYWNNTGRLRRAGSKSKYPYDIVMISLNKNLNKLLRNDPEYFDDKNKEKIINKHFMKTLLRDISDYVNETGSNEIRRITLKREIVDKQSEILSALKKKIEEEQKQIEAYAKGAEAAQQKMQEGEQQMLEGLRLLEEKARREPKNQELQRQLAEARKAVERLKKPNAPVPLAIECKASEVVKASSGLTSGQVVKHVEDCAKDSSSPESIGKAIGAGVKAVGIGAVVVCAASAGGTAAAALAGGAVVFSLGKALFSKFRAKKQESSQEVRDAEAELK